MNLANAFRWMLPLSLLATVWGLAAAEEGTAVLEGKTLQRKIDPVIMEGALAREVIGCSVENLRLYAHRGGAFEPIPFQIDEMTGPDGDWIMTGGPVKSVDLSNGRFDEWDRLVFMAEDTGDRVSPATWTGQAERGSQIEVVDPLTGEKGWCTFLCFASDPPARATQPPYVRYDYDTEIFQSDIWGIEYIITEDGRHTTFYKRHWVTEAAGGTGENFVDRLKIRPRITALGIPIHLNEERLRSNVIAHHIGPVRLIRRVEQYVKIGGLPAVRVVADVNYYRYGATVPVQFNVPITRPRRLGVTVVVRAGTDFGPVVLGSRAYSSVNPDGHLVDGKGTHVLFPHDPQKDIWSLTTGKWGTYMTRVFAPRELVEADVTFTMGMIDDLGFHDPPENFPGSVNFVFTEWDFSDVSRTGQHHLYLEFYSLPHYERGDEVRFLQYMDHPLRTRVGSRESASQPLLRPELEERYRRHWSVRAIERHLRENPM